MASYYSEQAKVKMVLTKCKCLGLLACLFFIPLATNAQTIKPRNIVPVLPLNKFKNVEDATELHIYSKKPSYRIQYRDEVNLLLKQINLKFILDYLSQLTSFPDRSSQTNYGVKAASWIKSQIDLMANKSGRQDISTYEIEINGTDEDGKPIQFKQPSVVTKIGSSTEPAIVIGAHFDTYPKYDLETSKQACKIINDPKMQKECVDNMSASKPGADDDGSGSAVILEIARTLINSGIQFNKPIYLVWYAAEEDGLFGSQSVVADFQKRNVPIAAVLQLDQVGFSYQNDPTMWLVTNYVDKDLTVYLATLINEYVKQPIKYTESKAPASDNYSWYTKGIPVSFPFEAEMKLGKGNIFVHTHKDTIDKLSLDHVIDYAKLALAFAVELSAPEHTKV